MVLAYMVAQSPQGLCACKGFVSVQRVCVCAKGVCMRRDCIRATHVRVWGGIAPVQSPCGAFLAPSTRSHCRRCSSAKYNELPDRPTPGQRTPARSPGTTRKAQSWHGKGWEGAFEGTAVHLTAQCYMKELCVHLMIPVLWLTGR